MMKYLLCLLSFISSSSIFANDGTYMSSGGMLYPQKETSISITKEILSFHVENGHCYVQVYFEFLNPEKQAKKLQVGFQAPTPAGDVSDSICNILHIRNFKVQQTGKLLPYSIKTAECEDCVLRNPGELQFRQDEPGVWVFLFNMEFQSGITIVQHSYDFPASAGIDALESYSYILNTGSKWAGGKIGELSVRIDYGQNAWFHLDHDFGPEANWRIIGNGKLGDKRSSIYGGNENSQMIRIMEGYLQIDCINFTPKTNISFGMRSEYAGENTIGTFLQTQHPGMVDYYIGLARDLSPEKLRILRNGVYARYGYAFNSPDLQKHFKSCIWYMPDPNLKMDDILLSKGDEALLVAIKTLEKKKAEEAK